MRVIRQQQSPRFRKLTTQKGGNERLKIRASFNAPGSARNWSVRILRAVRAHPARIRYRRQLRPHPLRRFVYHRRIHFFTANFGCDLIQDVFDFFVLHDFTPKMIPNDFFPPLPSVADERGWTGWTRSFCNRTVTLLLAYTFLFPSANASVLDAASRRLRALTSS